MKKTKEPKVKKEKVVKEKKVDLKSPINIDDGLDQTFSQVPGGKTFVLRSFLKEGEFWTLKKKDKVAVILTHDAVKRIADTAGIRQDPRYEVLTQPSYTNNYQYLIQCTVADLNRSSSELGESNRSNLGSRGRSNPANMAQKRAYDRAVFRHLSINGLLGEDELEEDKESNVKTLTPDEAKAIAPYINELLVVKKKDEIEKFNKKMKEKSKEFSEDQLNVLRKLRDTKMGEVTSTF